MLIDETNIAAVLAGLGIDDSPTVRPPEPTPEIRDEFPAPAGRLDDAAYRLHEVISDLIDGDPQNAAGDSALSLLRSLSRERHRLEAAYLRAVALADQLNAAVSAGAATSTAAYLKSALGVSAGRAKADVAAAQAVHGERSKELVPTIVTEAGTLAPLGRLLADGSVGLAHVDVGVKTLENLPARLVCSENLERITGFIAGHAPSTTPHEIRVLSDRLIRALEPEQDDHYDPESFNRRSFTMATDITGMVHGNYQLDPAAGAELRAIMDPLSAPRPEQRDEHGVVISRDERTPSQRRADALGELIRAGSTFLGPPAVPVASDGAQPTSPEPGDGAQPELFSIGECEDGSLGSRAGKLRLTRRQSRVTILTTMDQLQVLRQQRENRDSCRAMEQAEDRFVPLDPTPSHCDQLGRISSGALARMSCDGLFERVVLDAKGAVLDLGLPVRLASPAQRRALAARDRGCIAPGCDRPASWCEAHHIIWYSRGGPTDVANMALLCSAHHSQVHAGLLEVTMIDGVPYARPTPKARAGTVPIGSIRHPDQTGWIRNGHFDRLRSADTAARAILIRTG